MHKKLHKSVREVYGTIYYGKIINLEEFSLS